MAGLFATKPLDMILSEAHETGEHSLRRALGATNLISLGIGAIIGTGIFVLTGTASANHAGPAKATNTLHDLGGSRARYDHVSRMDDAMGVILRQAVGDGLECAEVAVNIRNDSQTHSLAP